MQALCRSKPSAVFDVPVPLDVIVRGPSPYQWMEKHLLRTCIPAGVQCILQKWPPTLLRPLASAQQRRPSGRPNYCTARLILLRRETPKLFRSPQTHGRRTL